MRLRLIKTKSFSGILDKIASIKLKQVFIFALFVVPVTALITLQVTKAASVSAVLTPNSDVTAQWPVLAGTADNSCSGTHCTRVDDGTTANDTDYVGTGTSGAGAEVDEYALSTATNVKSASKLVVTVRAVSATNANGGNLDTLTVNLRVNGTLQTATTITPVFDSTGAFSDYTATFNGTWTQADVDSMQVSITHNLQGGGAKSGQDDDVRIANVYGTLTYTKPSTHSQVAYRWFNNTSTYGANTGWWDTAWKSRKIITFDNSAATENLTDFPVLVQLTPKLIDYSKTQNDGQDIRFVDGDGVVLSHEIVSWDESDRSEVWVRIPQLDMGKADFIYMYYDNPAALDGQNKTGVWNSGFSAVQHLEEDVRGKGNIDTYADSTVNALHCNDNILAWQKRGLIKEGNHFDNAAGDTIDACGNPKVTGTFTFEAWINMQSITTEIDRFVSTHEPGVADGASIRHNGDGKLHLFFQDTGGVFRSVTASGALVANQWTYVTGTYGGSTLRLYKNGSQIASTATSATPRSTSDYYISSGAETMFGYMDEIRVSTVARSASWINATYKSGNNTLARIGAEENSVTNFSPLAAQDTAAALPPEGKVRLRLNINLTSDTDDVAVDSGVFKLQFAQRGTDNVCDTSFSGETYADVTNSTTIKFHDDPGLHDGAKITATTNDPVRAGVTAAQQGYETSNNFSNPVAMIAGQDGTWDFSLADNGAADETYYCFRAVKGDGAPLSSYSYIPELKKQSSSLDQSGYRWFENANTPWWNGSWNNRRKITFDNSAATENLVDFPVRVSLSSTNLDYTKTQNAGQDIRFIDADGTTLLSHEIEVWDEAGTSEVWVKVPQLDKGSTTDHIWVYYNNPTVSDGQNRNSVWDDNFRSVLHMSAPAGSRTVMDSSKFATPIQRTKGVGKGENDFVANVPGLVGNAQDFDGIDDRAVSSTDSALDLGTAFTLSVAVYWKAAAANNQYIIERGELAFDRPGLYFWMAKDGICGPGTNIVYGFRNAANTAFKDHCFPYAPTVDTWDNFTITLDGTNIKLYRNGALVDTEAETESGFVGDTQRINITTNRNGDNRINARLDEMSIASVARSASWIAAQNKTVFNTLNTIAAEEVAPPMPALAANGAAATAPAQGTPFRLKMLLHIGTDNLKLNAGNFKLQIAERSGTCDAGFSGEVFTDISQTTGPIRYHNNTDRTGGMMAFGGLQDPVHGSPAHPWRYQSYIEANNFSNNFSRVRVGEDALWDFALVDAAAPAATSYCFRAVKSDGTVLNAYSLVPEITTASGGGGGSPAALTVEQHLRGGQAVQSGAKSKFSW